MTTHDTSEADDAALPLFPAVPVTPGHPDALLLHLCDSVLDAHAETVRLGEPYEERVEGPPPDLWAYISSLVAVEHALTERAADLRATTIQGLRAKAAVMQTYAAPNADGSPGWENHDELLGWSISRDLLGLPGSVPDAPELPASAEAAPGTCALPGAGFARDPADRVAWLDRATREFAMFGMVEALSGKSDAELLAGASEMPAHWGALIADLTAVQERLAAQATVLHRLVIRMAMARLRRDQPAAL